MLNKKVIPGLLLTAIIGLFAHFSSSYIPYVNGVMFGLLLGIFLGNTFRVPERFTKGIGYSGSRVLEFSIVLMAFGISFSHFAEIGWQSLLLVVLLI
ncbi:MAG: putative sulfate exporter family transporter, partial [Cryomorphaceae bacterium]|nr:putative sulfate exporter family transporter [Cryomorphaceae bacterium]